MEGQNQETWLQMKFGVSLSCLKKAPSLTCNEWTVALGSFLPILLPNSGLWTWPNFGQGIPLIKWQRISWSGPLRMKQKYLYNAFLQHFPKQTTQQNEGKGGSLSLKGSRSETSIGRKAKLWLTALFRVTLHWTCIRGPDWELFIWVMLFKRPCSLLLGSLT